MAELFRVPRPAGGSQRRPLGTNRKREGFAFQPLSARNGGERDSASPGLAAFACRKLAKPSPRRCPNPSRQGRGTARPQPSPQDRAPRPQLWLSIDSCKMNKLLTSGQIQVLPNRRGTGPTMNQLTWPCPGAHNHTQTQLPNIFHESMCLAFWREGKSVLREPRHPSPPPLT